MQCLTCQWKLGRVSVMDEVAPGHFLCQICKTSKATVEAAPVLMSRSGISSVLFVGGFMLLSLATLLYASFPQLQATVTWTMLYSLYLIYFALGIVNIKRRAYL